MSLKEPPQPPEVPRRFRLHKHQMIGLPLLALLPMLALFQVIGDHTESVRSSTSSLQVEVEFPLTSMFKRSTALRVKVTNTSSAMIETVRVSIDTTYLSGFNNISITPSPIQAYVVELTGLRPHQKQEVIAAIEGHDYGRQEGLVIVSTTTDTIRQPISTYIFW